MEIAFPSAMALSHMWLDKEHPDLNARNLRDMWLPAIEWLYSERVRQLTIDYGDESRAKDADGTPLSDEAVLAAADFGLFVDLSSMCQKENDCRTEVEDGLFRHSLSSLDVVYAHKGLMSLLSTRVPEGVEVDRTYEDRGWCGSAACLLSPSSSPTADSALAHTHRTNFERAEGQLIKPDTFCVDIGEFTVEKAYEAAAKKRWDESDKEWTGFFAADRRGSVREEVGEGARGAGLVRLSPQCEACSASSSAATAPRRSLPTPSPRC